ncbi:hypothetical protein H7K62_05185 [Quadrisphaera sp. RL12-1S]|uniref:hypothetical protein n=1 Tax=Quadrisphaera sp. RL12-1S TaxID=2763011 RepID=UPI0016485DD9|nr:hypothetical protein [Quadrisphaera sp. RL12-1S]MBC3761081.1 hypothetical protein [Quadrisphaera sp. RL12-1S]
MLTAAWAARHNIIDASQLPDVEYQEVSADAITWRSEWLIFTATSDSLQLLTDNEAQVGPLRDVAIAVLRSLPDTPVIALGINYAIHFAVGGRENAHKLADTIAPKDIWGDALPLGGLLGLTLQSNRPGLDAGRVTTRIEPSTLIPPNGFFVTVNDHYDLWRLEEPILSRDDVPSAPAPPTTIEAQWELGQGARVVAIEVLERVWNDSNRRATEIFEKAYSFTGQRP